LDVNSRSGWTVCKRGGAAAEEEGQKGSVIFLDLLASSDFGLPLKF
jgi:hypothetical protein